MENSNSKTDTIIDLQKRGYNQDFVRSDENTYCVQRGDNIAADTVNFQSL